MIPHPMTVIAIREMERRLDLDRLARERADAAKAAQPAGRDRTTRTDVRRLLSMLRFALRAVARLPLAESRLRQRV